jgi:SEL1 protein
MVANEEPREEPETDPNRRDRLRQRQRQRQRRRRRLLEALVLLLILLSFALGGALVLVRQRLAVRERERARRVARAARGSVSRGDGRGGGGKAPGGGGGARQRTYKPFAPHTMDELHVVAPGSAARPPPYHLTRSGNRNVSLREHYWALARSQLSSWDPNLDDDRGAASVLAPERDRNAPNQGRQGASSSSSASANRAALSGLVRSAELGHPEAQFYAGVAHWSGIWPIVVAPSSSPAGGGGAAGPPFPPRLRVMSEGWSPSHPQHAAAALYLHMAAAAGHEEAAAALAAKLEHHQEALADPAGGGDGDGAGGVFGSTAPSAPSNCRLRLAYAEAAADRIVDRLQASPDAGRGKVAPPADRHVLYQLHLHGSASGSKFLDAGNQPDETAAALQFYRVRASSPDDPAAPSAAFTLAHLHHTGLRGVPVNLTEALRWYRAAAEMGHAEAAGHAGDFYLYGLGSPAGDEEDRDYGGGDEDDDDDLSGPAAGSPMPREGDPYQAYKWYERGLPYSIETCRKRWEMKLAKKDVLVCDPTCLNGMGVLLALGVPMMVGTDLDLAEQYLELAKEQGKADAAYNLAMVRLGWKSHWRTREQAEALERAHAEKERRGREEASSSGADGAGDAAGGGVLGAPLNQMPRYSLTRSEWQAIVTDLSTAASMGHIQARHRLAKLYSEGVQIEVVRSSGQSETERVTVVPQDCEKAYKNFRWVMDHGSLHRSRRMRRAYRQYMAGDLSGSLRNYLVAAETGNDLAQLNAAFLLEQGTCLGLSGVDCAKASVRLYKSAAARGHAEASLRVGDFYYYGRFREGPPSGLLGALQYVLYPERYAARALEWASRELYKILSAELAKLDRIPRITDADEPPPPVECSAEDETCRPPDGGVGAGEAARGGSRREGDDEDHSFDHDMEMAAHHYRLAADEAKSIRAHFNLGFLYEWGLGLKQDFPLAKRHYDLAMSPASSRVSDLPVALALCSLGLHERAVKLYRSWEEWMAEIEDAAEGDREGDESSGSSQPGQEEEPKAAAAKGSAAGRPVPPAAPGSTAPGGGDRRHRSLREKQLEIIVKQLLSFESLLILVLTAMAWVLMQRRTRRRRR